MCGAGWFSGVEGLQLRRWAFTYTTSIRFHGDVENAWRIGSEVVGEGRRHAGVTEGTAVNWPAFYRAYLNHYDAVALPAEKANAKSPDYRLDYSPGRLLIMSAWVKHTLDVDPHAGGATDSALAPLLVFNDSVDAVAALMMFALVLRWRKRYGTGDVAAVCFAFAAALLLWFNPSNVIVANTWPQWDTWPIPFFLLAMLLAGEDWFFSAGAVVAAGAMFKGQMLLVAPIFVAWPIFQARFGAACRAAAGFGVTFLGLCSLWLLGATDGNVDGFAWVGGVAFVALVFALGRKQFRIGWPWMMAALVAAAMVAWPCMRAIGRTWSEKSLVGWKHIFVAAACGPLIPIASRYLPRRATGYFCAAVAACALFFAAPLFGGSWAWYRIGFGHPQVQYQEMNMGICHNAANVLKESYGWNLHDRVTQIPETFHVPFSDPPRAWEVRDVLVYSYGLTLALCAIGAAIHARRNDPRLLVALLTPWVTLFALLPQMHSRYLVWSAAMAGVSLAFSVGPTLLQLVLTFASSAMMLDCMLPADPNFWPKTRQLIAALHPGFGWAVMVVAGVYLWIAVAPARRSVSQPSPI